MINNFNASKFLLAIFIISISGMLFGYEYRFTQIQLLVGQESLLYSPNQYLYYFLIGILVSLFIFQIIWMIANYLFEANNSFILSMLAPLMLGSSYFFGSSFSIQHSLQLVLAYLIFLILCVSLKYTKNLTKFRQLDVFYSCLIALFSLLFWQVTISNPINGYTDSYFARQIGSIGFYNQFASANLNQYSGGLPFSYATTHHHVVAYLTGLFGVSPQRELFDFISNNLFLALGFLSSTACLFHFLRRSLKISRSAALLGCIFFISNFYIYGLLNSGEKTHCYNYIFFPVVIWLCEKGIKEKSFLLIFSAGLLNHFPNSFLYTYPENFIVFDLIIGLFILGRFLQNSDQYTLHLNYFLSYGLGALSLAFWYLPILDFIINEPGSLGLSGYSHIQLHLGFGWHLPLIYPVYIGFVAFPSLVAFGAWAIYKIRRRKYFKIDFDDNIMWFLIFIFLGIASIGHETYLSKFLSIKDIAFPYTRYWFRFGSGITFASIIICTIGIDKLIKFSRVSRNLKGCFISLSLSPLLILISPVLLEKLPIFKQFGANLYLGSHSEGLPYLESSTLLILCSCIPIFIFVSLKYFQKTQINFLLLLGIASIIVSIAFEPLHLNSTYLSVFYALLFICITITIVINTSWIAQSSFVLTLFAISLLSSYSFIIPTTSNHQNKQGFGSLISNSVTNSRQRSLDFGTIAYASRHQRDVSVYKQLEPYFKNLEAQNNGESGGQKFNLTCDNIILFWESLNDIENLTVNIEQEIYMGINPNKCWTRFAEVVSTKNIDKYKNGINNFTFRQSLTPLSENVFNVAGMTGRPEIWRWFSSYNDFLPVPKGIDSGWYVPLEQLINTPILNDLSVSTIQMLYDDFKHFKNTEAGRRFKVKSEIITGNGEKFIFLEDRNAKPIANYKCTQDKDTKLGQRPWKFSSDDFDDVCPNNGNSIKILDLRGNFMAFDLNVLSSDKLQISFLNHRDWQILNFGSFTLSKNESEHLFSLPVEKGNGVLILEYASLPVKLGFLIFWILINLFLGAGIAKQFMFQKIFINSKGKSLVP
jgi:hypothetical protein